MNEAKTSIINTIFSMMINPSKAIKETLKKTKWYFGLIISGLAFAMFFLQTALDLLRTGQKGMDFVYFSVGIGAIYGVIVIPLISIIVWLLLKFTKSDKSITWTISSFCLSYSGALIYGTIGLIFSLFFSWKTAIAFGVTGVLWAIGPMIITVREMTNSKIVISVPIVTVFSGLVLVSWAFFSNL
ncbi:hypothetical protein [Helicovermis profundi]|uniref:Yip1 domain-containing protein n=1 Tax=Helicovermis profundi TaxID=3065157 RepID=A0AAU9E9S5_9FIRM|nr:hypothetical protein HLPR_03400 [Clostridia bacterium S502]